ncbi:MAG: flagellar hook assembly protein FlgD [Rubellimicrobium sp.]|nr:flagellar hook assembly protein FlgD [Rubellimicrobium sp.]
MRKTKGQSGFAESVQTRPATGAAMQPAAIASASTTPFTSGTTSRTISSDFETFLRMLTTQIRNQDPLKPVEASDYAVQLATFSSVEQQVLTNELLRGLAQRADTGNIAQMGGWIGQEVRVAAPVRLDGTPVEIALPEPPPGAGSRVLVVSDATGTEIQRLALPMAGGPVDWAGVTADGAPLPAGIYHLVIETASGEDSVTTEPAQIYARVTELRAGPAGPRLVLPGGVEVDAADVTALRAG